MVTIASKDQIKTFVYQMYLIPLLDNKKQKIICSGGFIFSEYVQDNETKYIYKELTKRKNRIIKTKRYLQKN